MSGSLVVMLSAAMVLLLAASGAHAYATARWRLFLVEASSLAGLTWFFYWLFKFPFPIGGTIAKGGQSDAAVTIVLFACTILGMLAQALYQHFTLPLAKRHRTKIDWGLFFAPICASPIVFIPLMVALENADVDLKALTVPRMMIFFVAFQNGFFWKEHFDRQRQDIAAGKS